MHPTDDIATVPPVAPLVGAWIEIKVQKRCSIIAASLPSWERGLKSGNLNPHRHHHRRSPRGSVD